MGAAPCTRLGVAGAAGGGLGAGVDQVGNGLCLGQIHLVVEECPLCEFPGLRKPQASYAAQPQANRADLGLRAKQCTNA